MTFREKWDFNFEKNQAKWKWRGKPKREFSFPLNTQAVIHSLSVLLVIPAFVSINAQDQVNSSNKSNWCSQANTWRSVLSDVCLNKVI
jgi:hypothetical protein